MAILLVSLHRTKGQTQRECRIGINRFPFARPLCPLDLGVRLPLDLAGGFNHLPQRSGFLINDLGKAEHAVVRGIHSPYATSHQSLTAVGTGRLASHGCTRAERRAAHALCRSGTRRKTRQDSLDKRILVPQRDG